MISSRLRRDCVETVTRLADRELDSRSFRTAVLAELHRVLEFDWHVWVLTDARTTVGVDPHAVVPDLTELPRMIRLKYLTSTHRWSQLDTVAALGDQASTSRLWREVQQPYGVVDVASAVFRDRFGCWGFLDLWSRRRYDEADLALLGELAPALTTALRHSQARTFRVVPTSRAPTTGPAVLLLGEDLTVVGQTTASPDWLQLLLPRPDEPDPIPACAYNLAAQLVALEHGVDDHEPLGRVHLRDGLWVTLRASRMEPGGLVAVTIEPTSPGDRLDLFARAAGLSPRERELLEHLAQGSDTREAAGLMFLSPHTVQDHLKSIFAKTGTHTRLTLLSHALGVRV